MILRTCRYCKKEFQFRGCPSDIASGRGNACSKDCANRKLPKTYKCQLCGKEKANTQGQIKKFCSSECGNKSRLGSIPWNIGKRMSEEVRLKISIAKLGSEPWNKGKPFPQVAGKNNKNWKGGISKFRSAYVKLRKKRIKECPGSHTDEEWNELKKKYCFTCPCCLRQEPEIRLQRDHIKPVTKKGSNSITNIQPLCKSCNSTKRVETKRFPLPIDRREDEKGTVEYKFITY